MPRDNSYLSLADVKQHAGTISSWDATPNGSRNVSRAASLCGSEASSHHSRTDKKSHNRIVHQMNPERILDALDSLEADYTRFNLVSSQVSDQEAASYLADLWKTGAPFSGFKADDLASLLQSMTFMKFPDNHPIIYRLDKPSFLALVVSGTVNVTLWKESLVVPLGRGCVVGELVDGQAPHSHTHTHLIRDIEVTAKSTCVLGVISYREIEAIVAAGYTRLHGRLKQVFSFDSIERLKHVSSTKGTKELMGLSIASNNKRKSGKRVWGGVHEIMMRDEHNKPMGLESLFVKRLCHEMQQTQHKLDDSHQACVIYEARLTAQKNTVARITTNIHDMQEEIEEAKIVNEQDRIKLQELSGRTRDMESKAADRAAEVEKARNAIQLLRQQKAVSFWKYNSDKLTSIATKVLRLREKLKSSLEARLKDIKTNEGALTQAKHKKYVEENTKIEDMIDLIEKETKAVSHPELSELLMMSIEGIRSHLKQLKVGTHYRRTYVLQRKQSLLEREKAQLHRTIEEHIRKGTDYELFLVESQSQLKFANKDKNKEIANKNLMCYVLRWAAVVSFVQEVRMRKQLVNLHMTTSEMQQSTLDNLDIPDKIRMFMTKDNPLQHAKDVCYHHGQHRAKSRDIASSLAFELTRLRDMSNFLQQGMLSWKRKSEGLVARSADLEARCNNAETECVRYRKRLEILKRSIEHRHKLQEEQKNAEEKEQEIISKDVALSKKELASVQVLLHTLRAQQRDDASRIERARKQIEILDHEADQAVLYLNKDKGKGRKKEARGLPSMERTDKEGVGIRPGLKPLRKSTASLIQARPVGENKAHTSWISEEGLSSGPDFHADPTAFVHNPPQIYPANSRKSKHKQITSMYGKRATKANKLAPL